MQLPSHLYQSRHGIWYFRVVLPDAVASLLAQREIKRSLNTRCPIAAKLAAYRLSARIFPVIKYIKGEAMVDPLGINLDDVRKLIAKGLEINVRTGVIRAEHFETDPNPEQAKRETDVLERIAQTLASQQPSLDKDRLQALLREQAEIDEILKPPVSKPSKLGEAVKDFIKFKKDLAPTSLTAYQYRLAMLVELLGGENKMLHAFKAEHCQEAADKFQQMAPHQSKRQNGNEPEDHNGVSAGTVKDVLTLWQSFFSWAMRTGRHAGPNPIAEIPRPKKSNTASGAEPFLESELKKIFDPELMNAMTRPHQFWGPLLALYTGARANEIAQLRLEDFIEDEAVKCIQIVHDEAGGTRLKNAESRRVLPLHPDLWEIGLQDYLNDLVAINAKRLFPNLPADKNGKREKYLSRDFNEGHLRTIGIHKPRVKVFHSFRDTVTGKLSKAKINPDHIDDWMGHARTGTNGEHYNPELTTPEKVESIFPAMKYGVDFSQIRYKKGQWSDWLKKHMVD